MTIDRRHAFKALAIGSAALFGASGFGGEAAAQRRHGAVDGPHIGRCHMGGCSWFDITAVTTVRQTPTGRLVRVSMREGGSEHRNNRYPSSARGARIEWQEVNGDSYYFCSTRHPAAIWESDGAWRAYPLDPRGPSGATEFTTSVYNHVCHPGVTMSAARARRLGYRSAEGEEMALRRPEDIFDHVR